MPFSPQLERFRFIQKELEGLRLEFKRQFGFTHVYWDDLLLCSLHNNLRQRGTNGLWLYTTTEYVDSLAHEFPGLPKRNLWRSGPKAWIVLAARLEGFEEYALKACELIAQRDLRIGRVSRRKIARR